MRYADADYTVCLPPCLRLRRSFLPCDVTMRRRHYDVIYAAAADILYAIRFHFRYASPPLLTLLAVFTLLCCLFHAADNEERRLPPIHKMIYHYYTISHFSDFRHFATALRYATAFAAD